MRSVPPADRHLVTSISGALGRLLRLENWAAVQSHPDIDFSEGGAISTGDFPPTAFPAGAGYAIGIVVLLGTTATSGTSTWQLKKNGSLVTGTSVSIAAGATVGGPVTFTAPGTAFVGPYSDILVPTCTAAGTGAKDATVLVQWRPAA